MAIYPLRAPAMNPSVELEVLKTSHQIKQELMKSVHQAQVAALVEAHEAQLSLLREEFLLKEELKDVKRQHEMSLTLSQFEHVNRLYAYRSVYGL